MKPVSLEETKPRRYKICQRWKVIIREEIFNCQLIGLLSLLVTQINQVGSTLAPLPTKKWGNYVYVSQKKMEHRGQWETLCIIVMFATWLCGYSD